MSGQIRRARRYAPSQFTFKLGKLTRAPQITIYSSTRKYKPIYNLKITTHTSSGPKTTILAKPFTQWFDAAGHFHSAPFQAMLASSVPIIAAADPQAAARNKKKDVEKVDDGKSMEESKEDLVAYHGAWSGSVQLGRENH